MNLKRITLTALKRKSETILTGGDDVVVKAIRENDFHFFRIIKFKNIENGIRGIGKSNYTDSEIISSEYTHFEIEYMSDTSMDFDIYTESPNL
ncbi:MAG TPA: hypothetical protein VK750_00825 [Cytophagaceae bacterium]|nr:hypothetical protein [Cytophagaceae bacterium]